MVSGGNDLHSWVTGTIWGTKVICTSGHSAIAGPEATLPLPRPLLPRKSRREVGSPHVQKGV